jgi:hypothetical protein
MKIRITKIWLLILVPLLAACSGVKENNQFVLATPAGTSTPTATITLTPTATVDYLSTAVIAKETSDEAMRVNVKVTAEADQRNFVQAQWTVTAEAVSQVHAEMTRQAAQFTATAYATSIPATQTAQAISNSLQGTEMAMTISAPTQLVAMANARALADTAAYREYAEMFVIVCAGFALIALGIGVLVMMYRDVMKPSDVPDPEPELAAPTIPFVHVPGPQSRPGGTRMLRAEIPCSLEQLLEFADGVVNRGMTLSINPWEGTPVHKSIKNIRAFFVQHEMAKVLLGKGGELGIEVTGEEFLQDTLAYKRPPLPYVCTQ